MIANYDKRNNANYNSTRICDHMHSIHDYFTIIRTNDNEFMSEGYRLEDLVAQDIYSLKYYEENGEVSTFVVYNGYSVDEFNHIHEHFTVFYTVL